MKVLLSSIISIGLLFVSGCGQETSSSSLRYRSNDGRYIVSGPDWMQGKMIDGEMLYPVTVNEKGLPDRLYWCKTTDQGSSGNFKVKTRENDFCLSDSSFCHSDNMDCITYVDFISGSTTNRICLDRISQ